MTKCLQDTVLEGHTLDTIRESAPVGPETELKTTLAKHIFNVLGDSSDLQRFDQLRYKLKQKRKTRSKDEIASYDQLLVKLQSQVLRLKSIV